MDPCVAAIARTMRCHTRRLDIRVAAIDAQAFRSALYAERMSSVDSRLLAIVACPVDRGSLVMVPDEGLYNPRLHLLYRIDDGIPVLLADEAETVSDERHDALLAAAAD